jgi:hypothetical protein
MSTSQHVRRPFSNRTLSELVDLCTHHLHKDSLEACAAELEAVEVGIDISSQRLRTWCQEWEHLGAEFLQGRGRADQGPFTLRWYPIEHPFALNAKCWFCQENWDFVTPGAFFQFCTERSCRISQLLCDPANLSVLELEWDQRWPYVLERRKSELQSEISYLQFEVARLEDRLVDLAAPRVPESLWQVELVKFVSALVQTTAEDQDGEGQV